MTPQQENNMKIVNLDIVKERLRQNELWGVQRHYMGIWLAILGEEFGEVSQAIQSYLGLPWVKESDVNAENLYEELIHLAAVSSAIAEQLLEEKSMKESA